MTHSFSKFVQHSLKLLVFLGFVCSSVFSYGQYKVLEPINPKSIDLTQPTLFLVPYSHLDDVWRWSYPQVIRDFLKQTLDDNFAALYARIDAKYPDEFVWLTPVEEEAIPTIVVRSPRFDRE